MTRTILIVDDEPNMRWVLGRALEQAGYAVHSAESGHDAAGLLARVPIDLVLLDLKLRGEDGLTILRRLRERQPDLVVLILTAYGTVPTAVEAMQLGAADFLRKPFDVEEVVFKIARALERRAMQQELTRLVVLQCNAPAFDALIGAEASWRRLVDQARQVAHADDHVLIVGEPGSGRATIARAIHAASRRAIAPLIELDLSVYHESAQERALFGGTERDGAWLAAGNGTLLLHGVAQTTSVHQALIERLTSRGKGAGPRLFVIAVDEPALAGALQGELPIRLRIPLLRERAGDILLLAHHFAPEHSITPAALQLLEHYAWPGNVTELRSVLERATQLAGTELIDSIHLPERLKAVMAPAPEQLPAEGVNLEQLEQALIRQALERAHGNKSRAAELLGLTRHTLLYRMEKYSISAPERD
jgi:two-component system NtrC family response regulator